MPVAVRAISNLSYAYPIWLPVNELWRVSQSHQLTLHLYTDYSIVCRTAPSQGLVTMKGFTPFLALSLCRYDVHQNAPPNPWNSFVPLIIKTKHLAICPGVWLKTEYDQILPNTAEYDWIQPKYSINLVNKNLSVSFTLLLMVCCTKTWPDRQFSVNSSPNDSKFQKRLVYLFTARCHLSSLSTSIYWGIHAKLSIWSGFGTTNHR